MLAVAASSFANTLTGWSTISNKFGTVSKNGSGCNSLRLKGWAVQFLPIFKSRKPRACRVLDREIGLGGCQTSVYENTRPYQRTTPRPGPGSCPAS